MALKTNTEVHVHGSDGIHASRTATIALSDYIGVDEWSRTEALVWLASQNLEGLGFLCSSARDP